MGVLATLIRAIGGIQWEGAVRGECAEMWGSLIHRSVLFEVSLVRTLRSCWTTSLLVLEGKLRLSNLVTQLRCTAHLADSETLAADLSRGV